MPILAALAAALLAATSVHARTLDMPDGADASLLRAYLSNTPPDFATMAANLDAARQASKFDRAAVLASETDRLRRDYTAMGDVDGIVLRLSDRLGEYDASVGGFPLRTFEPDIYVPHGATKVVFDNHRDFAAWKLPTARAREVVAKVDRWNRSVDLELTVRPFAVSRDSDGTLRTQVRSVRIVAGGQMLGEMATDVAEAPVQRAGDAAASAIPDERLDMLGLRARASYADFVDWAGRNGFTYEKMDEAYSFVLSLDFSARADGLLPSRFTPKPWGNFHPMLIAGGGFNCKSELDKEKLCGSVQFSPEPTIEAKRVLSIQMVQNVVGMTPEQVVAKLGEKYGPHTDSFDVVVSEESEHRARDGPSIWWTPLISL